MSTARAELTILLSAPPEAMARYAVPLRRALSARGLAAVLATDPAASPAPQTVDYIVYAPNDHLTDFTAYTSARAVLSLWAGVERIVSNQTLTQPLARMVDPMMTAAMMEFVVGHTLRHHLGMDAHIANPAHDWAPTDRPLAADRAVTILGLGALGTACGVALAGLGFAVTGWSRQPKQVAGLRCLSGAQGLAEALGGAQVVVTLLPLTDETENIMGAAAFARLAPGAVLINPGRGGLIDDAALLAALQSGQLGHATLDTFRTEPLPQGHPFWAHPGITVTPHIAAETRLDTAAQVIADNIARAEAGEPLLHLVDRAAGY